MKDEVSRAVLKHLEAAAASLDKATAELGSDGLTRAIATQLKNYSAAITECRTALASTARVARTERRSNAAYGQHRCVWRPASVTASMMIKRSGCATQCAGREAGRQEGQRGAAADRAGCTRAGAGARARAGAGAGA